MINTFIITNFEHNRKAIKTVIILLIDQAAEVTFWEINKGLWFLQIWKIFLNQFTKRFYDSELLPGAAQYIVAVIKTRTFFQNT